MGFFFSYMLPVIKKTNKQTTTTMGNKHISDEKMIHFNDLVFINVEIDITRVEWTAVKGKGGCQVRYNGQGN